MIYQSTQSDDYLWYLILRRGKQKKTKNKQKEKTPEYQVAPYLWNVRNNNSWTWLCTMDFKKILKTSENCLNNQKKTFD